MSLLASITEKFAGPAWLKTASKRLSPRDSHPWKFKDLTPAEQQLYARFPVDYQQFLARWNGCLLDPQAARFSADASEKVALEEVYGYLSYERPKPEEGKPHSLLHEHYDRHQRDEFLPSDVYVIGHCSGGGLLCLSLNPEQSGKVFYWNSEWQKPENKKRFDEKCQPIWDRYPQRDMILKDPEHPQHRALLDSLSFAMLTPVAKSFSEFVGGL